LRGHKFTYLLTYLSAVICGVQDPPVTYAAQSGFVGWSLRYCVYCLYTVCASCMVCAFICLSARFLRRAHNCCFY